MASIDVHAAGNCPPFCYCKTLMNNQEMVENSSFYWPSRKLERQRLLNDAITMSVGQMPLVEQNLFKPDKTSGEATTFAKMIKQEPFDMDDFPSFSTMAKIKQEIDPDKEQAAFNALFTNSIFNFADLDDTEVLMRSFKEEIDRYKEVPKKPYSVDEPETNTVSQGFKYMYKNEDNSTCHDESDSMGVFEDNSNDVDFKVGRSGGTSGRSTRKSKQRTKGAKSLLTKPRRRQPVPCEICGKQFVYRARLATHRKKHTDVVVKKIGPDGTID